MQREISPTSPTLQKAPVLHKSRFFYLVLLVIFCGLFSGFFGYALSRSYPTNWPFAKEILGTLDDDDATRQSVLVIKDRSVNERQAIFDNLILINQQSILGIYKSQTADYASADYLGSATVISSDGWLASAVPLTKLDDFKTIDRSGDVYAPEKMINDPVSGLIFIKISAQNLTPVAFTDPASVKIGMEAVGYYYLPETGDNMYLTQLSSNNYWGELAHSTQKYNKRYLLSTPTASTFINSPLWSLDGKLMGFSQADGKVLTMELVPNILSNIFSAQQITHSAINWEYYDLEQAYQTPTEHGAIKKGALISKADPLITEVLAGDILTQINGQDIDSLNNLSKLILEEEPETPLNITLIRAGENLEIVIK